MAVPGGQEQATGRAVVVGGSMAGLLAARVLADHFEDVVVVDRDTLPDGTQHRRGVPQDHQFHVMLARGLRLIDGLLPGYVTELQAAGAVQMRVPSDILILTPAGWLDRGAPGWEVVSASRPVFETTVRRRVRQLPGVDVLDGHEVTGVRPARDGSGVTGVRVRPVSGAGSPFELPADVVVDAAGRGSRAVAWLRELGHPSPPVTEVDPKIAYATRVFRMPDGFSADWKAVMLSSKPPSIPRTGYLFPIEDGQWMVCLMGAAGQHPPTDEDGWRAFARSLRHPVIADAVADAEPVSPIRAHRGTTNRLLRFEKMARWPEGLIVLGDAACAFNPIYGQGMSVAAVAADTLGSRLRQHRRDHRADDRAGLAAATQRALARAMAAPWMLSTGEDLRFPTTTGAHAGAAMRAQHRYLDRVVAAATHDPAVADVYVRLLGMLAAPTAVFSPRVLAAAARAGAPPDHDHRAVIPPPRRAAESTSAATGPTSAHARH
ncbi:NAD(P)/FAD-dependent oxidoreductase [Blastococcus sp. SYSU DS0541]